jgi:hypothetical protein
MGFEGRLELHLAMVVSEPIGLWIRIGLTLSLFGSVMFFPICGLDFAEEFGVVFSALRLKPGKILAFDPREPRCSFAVSVAFDYPHFAKSKVSVARTLITLTTCRATEGLKAWPITTFGHQSIQTGHLTNFEKSDSNETHTYRI